MRCGTLVGNICVCDVRFARNYFREGAYDQPRNRPLILHDLQIPTYNRTSLAKLPRAVPKTIDASRS